MSPCFKNWVRILVFPFQPERSQLRGSSDARLTITGKPFRGLDRVICRAIGRLVSDGQMSKQGSIRAVKGLMYENQKRLFRL
jgi:hypothetical protein